MSAVPQTIYLKDYQAPAFAVDSVKLSFELGEEHTIVHCTSQMKALVAGEPLVLDGIGLELVAITLNGEALRADDHYTVSDEYLNIHVVPDSFELVITTKIKPQENTTLEGLYQSSGNFCTQCEADGFRHITYFLDRPDVMTTYTTEIIGDKTKYPVLLSNGNLIETEDLPNGMHRAVWHDPHKKPCYLFALVAGNLKHIQDEFVTASGRKVDLRIYVEPQNIDKCKHAMLSLKNSMKWDEDTFGLEYDLDIYMIVAVDDFNMGAMENKGLNVFNSKYVLARPDTATDTDYAGIEAVIGHEYFHNWTGNRVTCRDWFQLSLKEGLTVFRDQEFSSDMGMREVKRIEDVRMLRTHQFREDAGATSHPVRPASYIELNNLYTLTVYEKGAEVIRMYHTLLGKDGFRRGMDLYFERHDGQAVTTDDFCAAMADANDYDLEQFKLWYGQAGTPELTVRHEHDAAAGTLSMTVTQRCPDTAGEGQSNKLPNHLPLAMGLLGRDGNEIPLQLEGETEPKGTSRVLDIKQAEQTFVFQNVGNTKPVLSLLRDFSAPVKLDAAYTEKELIFLLANDTNSFTRWDASQTLATELILSTAAGNCPSSIPYVNACKKSLQRALDNDDENPGLAAELFTLPSLAYLAELMNPVDIDALQAARTSLFEELAFVLQDEWLAIYERFQTPGDYNPHAAEASKRALKNVALKYITSHEMCEEDHISTAQAQFASANNMTDSIAALAAILHHGEDDARQPALTSFYQQWQNDPLVMDKWLSLQASMDHDTVLDDVKALLDHPAFSMTTPNKVRAVIGAFTHNLPAFHQADGSGYQFIADKVIELNAINPQIAARIVTSFSHMANYDDARKALASKQVDRILATENLSKNIYEIASKSKVTLG